MRRFVVACVALVVASCSMSPAFADPLKAGACGKWDDVLKEQYKRTGELPTYGGATPGGVLSITVNPKTNTFTMFVQPTPDRICLMGSGRYWNAYSDATRLFPMDKS